MAIDQRVQSNWGFAMHTGSFDMQERGAEWHPHERYGAER